MLFAASSSGNRNGLQQNPTFSISPATFKPRWGFLRGGESAAEDTAATESSSTQYRTLQIQLVHRHGDRTPITPLRDEDFWASKLVPQEMLQKVAKGTKVLHHEKSESKHVAHGRGPFGKLTQMGLLQMIQVGTRLRVELEQQTAWAKDKLAFTGGQFQLFPRDIKIYSTDFDRTIQSVQGVLVGFFPDGPSEEVDIDCRHTTSWMIPDPQPRRTHEQEELELELARRPHMVEREAEMKPLAIRCTQHLLPLLGEDAFQVSYGVGEETSENEPQQRRLSWAQLSEITNCLQVYDLLPDGITKEDQEATGSYCAWKWFESLRNPRLAYLSMHHFTHTITHSMKDHDKEPPIIIYSCHDSSLIGLLCAFHLEQPSVWPEYGSVLKMEVLQKIDRNSNQEEEVVRFYLNGELLRSMWHGQSRDEIPLKKLSHYVSTVGAVKA
jgi:acid phosphatase